MGIDISNIKLGDEVTVRMIITRAHPDDDGDIQGDGGATQWGVPSPMFFSPENIVSHISRSSPGVDDGGEPATKGGA